jgi:hypothetical protein
VIDNCIGTLANGNVKSGANPAQDDTDGDLCGNICDPNQGQGGIIGFPDIISTINAFGLNSENNKTREPVASVVGFPDIIDTINHFSLKPGPSANSGTSAACPTFP